jgi:hypothetical protein
MSRIFALGLMLILSSPVGAQTRLLVYSGSSSGLANFSIKDNTDYLQHYWNTAINVGVGVEYMLSKDIAVSPRFEISDFSFDRYFPFIGIPEEHMKRSTGEATRVYRVFVDAKLMPLNISRTHLYVSTGTGYVVEDVGRIEAMFGDTNGPDFSRTIAYRGKSFWAHSAGIGLRMDILKKLGLDVSGDFYSNYLDRFWVSWRAGFVYTVLQ